MLRTRRPTHALACIAAAIATGCTSIPEGPIMQDAPARIVEQQFSADAIRADLTVLARTVRATAPEGYLAISEEEVAQLVEAEIAALSAGGDRRQAYAAALRIAAAFRSYHVYVLFPHEDWNAEAAGGGRVLGEDVLLTADGLSLSNGQRIERINGEPADRFVTWFRTRYDTHNPLRQAARMRESAASILWTYGAAAPLTFDLAGESVPYRAQEAPMRPRTHPLARGSGGAETAAALNALPFRFDRTAGGVAIDVDVFDPRFEAQWNVSVASLSNAVRANQIERAVIDLRGNAGGSGRMARALAEALLQQPVPMSGGKIWRRSPEYESALAQFVPAWLR